MKKALIILVFVALVGGMAATVNTIPEKTTIDLFWEHAEQYDVRLYIDGVSNKTIVATNYTLFSMTNGVKTWTYRDTAPKAGVRKFTLTSVMTSIESDYSNVHTQAFRPNSPGNFNLKDK
jgi:hypothetical protein